MPERETPILPNEPKPHTSEVRNLDLASQADRILLDVLKRNGGKFFSNDGEIAVPTENGAWEEFSVIVSLIQRSPQYILLSRAHGVRPFAKNPMDNLNRLLFSPKNQLNDSERPLFDPSFRNFSAPPLFEPYEPDDIIKKKLKKTAEEKLKEMLKRPFISRQKEPSEGLIGRVLKKVRPTHNQVQPTKQSSKTLSEGEQFEMLNQAYQELMQKVPREFLRYWTGNYTLIEEASDDFLDLEKLAAEELEQSGIGKVKIFSIGEKQVALLDNDAGEIFRKLARSEEFNLIEQNDYDSLEELEEQIESRYEHQLNIGFINARRPDLTEAEKRGLVALSLQILIDSYKDEIDDPDFYDEDLVDLEKHKQTLTELDSPPISQPELRGIVKRVLDRVMQEQKTN